MTNIILIGDEQATLYTPGGAAKTLTSPTEIADHSQQPLQVVINTADTIVKKIEIPKLRLFDRLSFYNSQMKLHAKETPLTQSIRHNKVGLTLVQTKAENPWLLAMQNCLVKGIFSLPALTTSLLPQAATNSHVLILTNHGTNGWRHSVFLQGQLCFTRLTPESLIDQDREATIAFIKRQPHMEDDKVKVLSFSEGEIISQLKFDKPMHLPNLKKTWQNYLWPIYCRRALTALSIITIPLSTGLGYQIHKKQNELAQLHYNKRKLTTSADKHGDFLLTNAYHNLSKNYQDPVQATEKLGPLLANKYIVTSLKWQPQELTTVVKPLVTDQEPKTVISNFTNLLSLLRQRFPATKIEAISSPYNSNNAEHFTGSSLNNSNLTGKICIKGVL